MKGALFSVVLALLAPAGVQSAAPPASASAAGAPRLSLPIACDPGRTCEIQHYVDRDPGPGTRDYHCGLQTYDRHDGIDIRLPDMAAERRGVAVLAAAPGVVTGVRDGEADISIRAPGAPSIAGRECGNGVLLDHGGGWATQYCHMARGSVAVKPGQKVETGTPLGRVGLSGNTEFPHLHLTVRHDGKAVDPFAPDATDPTQCRPQATLWAPAAQARLAYHAGAILNGGFADGPVSMETLEGGQVAVPTAGSPMIIFYARGIALLPGDEVELALTDPQGASLAQARRPPLAAWRAQDLSFVGRKRPAAGWAKGRYVGDYRVWRQGKVAISRRFELTI